MLYTEMTKKALKICFDAHKDQLDKGGLPYVFHPYHLAEQMRDEDTIITALLHDVVEDTDITFEDLEAAGFSDTIIEAIRLLTHKSHLSDKEYISYIAAIKDNKIARRVKLEDLRHNSDLSRLNTVGTAVLNRKDLYHIAMLILEEA